MTGESDDSGVMKEWLSVAELSKLTAIPESTLRRYMARFDKFFTFDHRSRGRRYHNESVLVLSRIQQMYSMGLEAEDIEFRLTEEFAVNVEDDSVQAVVTSQDVSLMTREDFFRGLAAVHSELEKVREEIAATRNENAQLKTFISERLEERDRRLMEVLRNTTETSVKKSKWKFWKN